ncbi:MAG: acetyl-CoA carboxylase biotin carboxyl carrier protein subunit [Bacteroidales bacterium]|nr:acetyl-CoA carboxylase biotin carboxyl carrier protein subunit [Bacteroidales bacterium]
MESQGKKTTKRGKSVDDKFEDFYFEDTSYRTTLNEKFKNRKPWKAQDPKLIVGVIPGTIVEVFVTEGQDLKKGEPLLILEAMKMRNVVCMPLDGIVKSILVEKGAVIPKGHLLVEIE